MTPAVAARAFAPGHITGCFVPAATNADPRARGSLGAGVVLDVGVHATVVWRPGAPSALRVNGGRGEPLPISLEVARRLVGARRGRLELTLAHELPIGQGFGMSAAGALATGLAVASALGVERRKAIEVAHLSDLYGEGGLGGVAAILNGGLEVRRRPGLPPWGTVVHRPWRGSIFLALAGPPVPTSRRLGEARWLRHADEFLPALRRLARRPTPAAWFALSERFTDRAALGPARIQRLLRELRRSGAWAAQTMFGSAVFAQPKDPGGRERLVAALEGARVHALEVGVAARGARAEPERSATARRYPLPRFRGASARSRRRRASPQSI